MKSKLESELLLPEWQKKELDRRLALYEKGEMKTRDGDKVHEELKEKYKLFLL